MDENKEESKLLESSIFSVILLNMKLAQQMVDKEGIIKKAIVLERVKIFLGADSFERYEPFIELSIDLIKALSKNKEMLDGLESLKSSVCLGKILSCTFC